MMPMMPPPGFDSRSLTLVAVAAGLFSLAGRLEAQDRAGQNDTFNCASTSDRPVRPAGVAHYCQSGLASDGDTGHRDTIPAGTTISIRTNDRVDARRSDGQVFGGAVSQEITDETGRVSVPRGAHAEFTVRNLSDRSLVLVLESVDVNGVRYAVTTSSIRSGGLTGRRSLVGSIADALASDNQGTATAGGPGAGRGFQLFGSGRNIRIPAEAVLTFRLVEPLQMGRRP